jgi:hypothetical protein
MCEYVRIYALTSQVPGFKAPMSRCWNRDFKFLALGKVENLENGLIPTAIAMI